MKSGTEKRPNPCTAPLARFLAAISRPLSGETAKHYRQRKDGAIVRAVPKPDKRRRKIKAKIIRPPKQARQRERAEPTRAPRAPLARASRTGYVNLPRAHQDANERARRRRRYWLEAEAWPKKEKLPRRLRRYLSQVPHARFTGKNPERRVC